MIKEIHTKDNKPENSHLHLIVEGVKESVNLAAGTLGPQGKTVIIDDEQGNSFTPTKDGFTVAKTVEFENPIKNIGAKAVHTVCKHVADTAGDGTTTAAVLFRSMIESGADLVTSNRWSRDTEKGVEYAINHAIKFLETKTERIDQKDLKRLSEIATISTNGDKKLGEIVSNIVSKVGPEGVVSVSDSKSMDTHYSYVDGMKLKQGFSSPHFKTSEEKDVCEMENVHIFVYSGGIKTLQGLAQMAPILEGLKGEPLLILCSDFSDTNVLGTILLNNTRGLTKICASKLPSFGDNMNKIAEDIAIFTGAEFIDESKGMSLSKCTFDCLGKADKIIVDKDNTTIIGGQGSKSNIEARCKVIQNSIDELDSGSEYKLSNLRERMAGLKGIAAVVHVGGIAEEEQKEVKYRIEDAIQASKSAVKYGIVPGGSSSLVRASRHVEVFKKSILSNPKVENSILPFSYCETDTNGNTKNIYTPCSNGFIDGIDMVIKALCEPIKQILLNAGLDDEWQNIVHAIKTDKNDKIGYDVGNLQLADMYENGIVDPLSSPVEALSIIKSMSSMISKSHGTITTKREEKANNNSPGMGMPGGMY